jgi:hypothetical protein
MERTRQTKKKNGRKVGDKLDFERLLQVVELERDLGERVLNQVLAPHFEQQVWVDRRLHHRPAQETLQHRNIATLQHCNIVTS